jgi:hypothetical protein
MKCDLRFSFVCFLVSNPLPAWTCHTAVVPEGGAKVADVAGEKSGTSESVAPEAAGASGLMTHQKDEHDIWVCKDCGWKYPNAKPSPKIKRNHKKKCTGQPGGAAETDEASDENSGDEHEISSSPAPVGVPMGAPEAAKTELPQAAEIPAAVEPATEDPAVAPKGPGSISREVDLSTLKEPSKLDPENDTTALTMAETTAPLAGNFLAAVYHFIVLDIKCNLSEKEPQTRVRLFESMKAASVFRGLN